MRLLHISLTARDASALATFYCDALGYIERRPPRTLSGDRIARGNGLPGAEITAIWLTLPGNPGPFLEILQYTPTAPRACPLVNEPGFGHLAFAVHDLSTTIARILASGGRLQGQITDLGTPVKPCLCAYVRDPEGNVLELEDRLDPA